jgi:predicted HTH transcriptional regulator
LRECCINAFCHRAYHRPGGSVGIAIYDDRVEIESSGAFPPDMTLEKLLGGHSSEPPNLIIANVLYKSELLESWGRGISLMIDECRRAGIPDPEFHTDGSSVWVVFRYEMETAGQASDKHPTSTRQAPDKYPTSIVRLIELIGEHTCSLKEMMGMMELKDRENFLGNYFNPSMEAGINCGRLPETTIREEIPAILEKFDLLHDGKLNNAAAVLFGRNLYDYPQCLLRMARFRGTSKEEFIDNQRQQGNIYALLDAAMSFFFKHLSLSGKIEGLYREEKLSIPYKALRECCINAFCHRAYHRPGGSVGIAIYDDRVEIESSGAFPPDMLLTPFQQSLSLFGEPVFLLGMFRLVRIERFHQSGFHRRVKVIAQEILPVLQFHHSHHFFQRASVFPYQRPRRECHHRCGTRRNQLRTPAGNHHSRRNTRHP